MLVGASPKRKEDGRFVAGRGRYLDDLRVPGLLHVALVRSPHAHARVVSVDGRAARALTGVAAVWTLADLPELAAANVPPLVPEPKGRAYVHPIMAGQRARHVGEIVAIVVADDPYVAADGAERVAVAYEPLPAALSPRAATAPGAARVNDTWPDNLVSVSAGAKGDVERALATADVVVSARLGYPRVAGMPLETRGVLAATDPIGGGLTVWTSTQVPFAVRSGIAPVVGLPEERIRVIVPDVGGGFGVKGHVYPEEILLPVVARRLGRPVKWTETRSEHCLTAAGDRDQDHEARIGLQRDGRIVAIDTAFTRDHGASPMLGEAITLNTINHLPGPYQVPNYRGIGRNVAHPQDVRRRLSRRRPARSRLRARSAAGSGGAAHRDGSGRAAAAKPDPGRRDAAPHRAHLPRRRAHHLRPGGLPGRLRPAPRARSTTPAGGPSRRSAGGARDPSASGSAPTSRAPGSGPSRARTSAWIPDGTVFVHLGVCAQGQGHETTLAQIAADELAVPLESVVVVGGDTSLVGYGMGTIASRVAAVSGPAVQRTAAQVAHKARLVAAELFECAPEDVVLAEGRVHVKGVPGKSVSLGQVARAAVRSRAVADAGGPGLSACAFFYPDTVTWAFGVQGVVAEVDRGSVQHPAAQARSPCTTAGGPSTR